jgi:hypothetical protein
MELIRQILKKKTLVTHHITTSTKKKTCGKTTNKKGSRHQEGLFIAAECKRKEEVRRGREHYEANY